MAESQQSQEASAGGTHCPKADSVGFEDDHDQTAQEIPVNEVPENEALSLTRITGRIFFTDLANKQLRTISPEVLSLDWTIWKSCTHQPPEAHKALLDQNHVQDICEEPGELKCLLSLDLSNNPFSCSLLPVISKLQSLCQLRLYKKTCTKSQCRSVNASIMLNCLAFLTMSQKNRFENFPKELCHIANLEIIDLEQNLFSLIPEEVGFLTNLVKLFLAFNNLSSIPPTLQRCQKLAVQDLSHNLLHKLPPALKNLTEMRTAANSLEKFPHQICCWLSLSRVYLRNTGLRTVPRSFTRLTSVRILDLSENCFDEIPKGIGTMKYLEVLALDGNQIQEIPAEVKELTNLKRLSLSENQFSIFPKEIFLLESLERLYLGQDTGIKSTSLPEDISKLQNLKELHMENNCLECLPTAIG
ncbi:LOW QUALITY PROTEIN: hypothetical protein QYF61_000646 [Mycteria americana]|uniref:Disease resistance R13L4/SHOC-2-like LRR domain-containing protein n=1 Tax=Mycteria americana TaxID=33587 RepID=A0AAN7NWQ0_MYCAM|nr:LOW QUALITY PROTEIN: hypothetical protein QYF61_000646 [Mycteria americana]